MTEGSPSGRFRQALSPTWSIWILSTLAVVVIAWIQWETWDTGSDRAWIEHHFYWPWYTWSHGDFVRGPSPGLLTWNYFSGLAICYLPIAIITAAGRPLVAHFLVRITKPLPEWGMGVRARFALTPRRTVGTILFALIASWIPPGPLSVYVLPGMLLQPVLAPVVAFSAELDPYSDFLAVFYPALAFPFWYVVITFSSHVWARLVRD